jgi:hypothetical protein
VLLSAGAAAGAALSAGAAVDGVAEELLEEADPAGAAALSGVVDWVDWPVAAGCEYAGCAAVEELLVLDDWSADWGCWAPCALWSGCPTFAEFVWLLTGGVAEVACESWVLAVLGVEVGLLAPMALDVWFAAEFTDWSAAFAVLVAVWLAALVALSAVWLAAVVAAPAVPAPAAAPVAAAVLDESELLVPEFDALVFEHVDATSDALCRLISLPETVPLIETVWPSLPESWLRSPPVTLYSCPFALRL